MSNLSGPFIAIDTSVVGRLLAVFEPDEQTVDCFSERISSFSVVIQCGPAESRDDLAHRCCLGSSCCAAFLVVQIRHEIDKKADGNVVLLK